MLGGGEVVVVLVVAVVVLLVIVLVLVVEIVVLLVIVIVVMVVGWMRKFFFYIQKIILTKHWGEKNARNNFSRNTRIVLAKKVWKKIVGKKFKKLFFIFTRIS